DMAGDSAERISHSPYLRGAAGHLVVADGTQPESLEEAQRVVHEVTAHYGSLPLVFLVNKNDLANLWRVSPAEIERLGGEHGKPFVTSAKTGENVEQAFLAIAEKMAAADSTPKTS